MTNEETQQNRRTPYLLALRAALPSLLIIGFASAGYIKDSIKTGIWNIKTKYEQIEKQNESEEKYWAKFTSVFPRSSRKGWYGSTLPAKKLMGLLTKMGYETNQVTIGWGDGHTFNDHAFSVSFPKPSINQLEIILGEKAK